MELRDLKYLLAYLVPAAAGAGIWLGGLASPAAPNSKGSNLRSSLFTTPTSIVPLESAFAWRLSIPDAARGRQLQLSGSSAGATRGFYLVSGGPSLSRMP